jgi:hypothetical protein
MHQQLWGYKVEWKSVSRGTGGKRSNTTALGYYPKETQGKRAGNFLFTTASRTALGPTQPPTQRVPGALSLRVKRPGREADHSPPSSAEVKNVWSYTSILPHTSSWRGAKLSAGTLLYLYHPRESRKNSTRPKYELGTYGMGSTT